MTLTDLRAPASSADPDAPARVLPARPPMTARVGTAALRLIGAVTTPLLPSDYLDVIDPLHNGADLRGRILRVEPETADSATLVIRPGRRWAGHIPGQYVRLGAIDRIAAQHKAAA